MKIKFEDEQKFRVIRGPLNDLGIGTEVTQGYICVDPPVRIRTENFEDSILTIKLKESPGLNIELEDEIPPPMAPKLMACHKYHKIRKTRYKMGRLEVDIFYGPLEGLVLIEFEKQFTEERAEIPKEFVVKEVTGDPRFENHNLCQLDRLPKEWRCQDVSSSI